MRNRLLLAIALMTGTPALAAPPPWQGVWEGTIGKLPIVACLKRDDYGANSFSRGYYYYLSQKKIIALTKRGDSALWIEGDGDVETRSEPAWQFTEIGGPRLSGRWSAKGNTLPFVLARKAGTNVETDCDDYAFNGQRITAVRLRTAPAKKDGVTYTRLIYVPGPQFDVNAESFTLPETQPGDAKVNALLRAQIPADYRKNDFLECVFGGLAGGAGDGSMTQVTTPTMITRNWLATNTDEGDYCGGAHPNSGTTLGVYDRKGGRKVEPLDWLVPAAIVRKTESGYTSRTATPAFRSFILSFQADSEAECRETLTDSEYWDAGLSRKGMIFIASLPHVAAGCAEEITIPFARIERWLNPAGRAAIASVRADLASR